MIDNQVQYLSMISKVLKNILQGNYQDIIQFATMYALYRKINVK
jgi:hypothetical protein